MIANHHKLLDRVLNDAAVENETVAYLEILDHEVVIDGPYESWSYFYENADSYIRPGNDVIRNPWVHEFVQSKLKVMQRYRNIVRWERIAQEKACKEAERLRAIKWEAGRAARERAQAKRDALREKVKDLYPFEKYQKDRYKLYRYHVDPKEYVRKKMQRATRLDWDREWRRQSLLRAIKRSRKMREYVMRKVFQDVERHMKYITTNGAFIGFKSTKSRYSHDFNFQELWDSMLKIGYYYDRHAYYPQCFDLVLIVYGGGENIEHGSNWTNQLRNLMEGKDERV